MLGFKNAKRKLLTTAVLGLSVLDPISMAHAKYPDQPIKLVVPYPTGGATDVIGRIVGKALAEELNTSVVVDNRSGASGSIGATNVARSKADGYTILLGALTSHSIYQNLYANTSMYDLNKDFEPIAIVGKVPLVFVVNPKVEAKTLQELIELAKNSPDKYTIASSGNGSPQQMAAALFGLSSGVSLTPVPYRGSGPAMTDLVGGQVDAMIDTVPAAQAFVLSDKLRALAVTSKDRAPTLPEVPTAKEAGLDDFEVSSMFGVLAPTGTPPEVIKTLTGAIEKILENQEVKDALLNQGVVAGYENPEQAKKEIDLEIEKWKQVIDKASIKASES